MCCCPTARDVLCALLGFALALLLISPWTRPAPDEPAVDWADMAAAGSSIVADVTKAALRRAATGLGE